MLPHPLLHLQICRRILRCPSLQRAQAGVGAGRGCALFWELYSITKCFLLCARFWKTLLSDNPEKQGVLKFCVVYFFLLFSHCLELRYAQRVQEKVYCCLFLYKSFDFFFFFFLTTVRLPLTCRSQHKQTDFSFVWFYTPNPGDTVVTRSLSFAARFTLTIWMSEEWLYFLMMHQTLFFLNILFLRSRRWLILNGCCKSCSCSTQGYCAVRRSLCSKKQAWSVLVLAAPKLHGSQMLRVLNYLSLKLQVKQRVNKSAQTCKERWGECRVGGHGLQSCAVLSGGVVCGAQGSGSCSLPLSAAVCSKSP